jgi:hypothetical protein
LAAAKVLVIEEPAGFVASVVGEQPEWFSMVADVRPGKWKPMAGER